MTLQTPEITMGPHLTELTHIFLGFEDILLEIGYTSDEISLYWAKTVETYFPDLLFASRAELGRDVEFEYRPYQREAY